VLRKSIVLLLACLLPTLLFAAKKFTISGYVTDSRSGESLPNATIQIVGTDIGLSTNNFGFYSITVDTGTYNLKVNYVGYENAFKEVVIKDKNMKLNIELSGRSAVTKEIIVRAKRKDKNVKTTEVGMHQLNVESIKKLPVILGEVDILKTIQLLPGVKNGGEGSSGFYVRGGGPDQNLILLDDAVVYNTGHLFGFFSVFNGDAVKNVTLIKGGMPANYGGRLSSVIDVTMKEGNTKAFKVDGGIGLIASRLSIQGPIVKDKGSFILSGRRTYATELLKLAMPNNERLQRFGYYFYDFNAKANYKINENNRVYLSTYIGDDVFKFSNSENTFSAKIPWGNRTATARWNHLFSSKLFMNVTAVYNRYDFEFAGAQTNFNVSLKSGIRDWNLKTDFDYFTNGHSFKGGVASTYHTFQPSTFSGTNDSVALTPVNPVMKYALENSAYILDDFDVKPWWRINAGLRYSNFLHLGPYTRYDKANGINVDSTNYESGKVVKTYGGLEPRLNMRFTLGKTSSIKTSVTRSNQYIHLVTNNGSTLPTDLWVPSTLLVQPQRSWQYSAGFFKNWLDNMLESSVELYYKDMRNQLEYRESYTPNNNNDPEYEFVQGKGWAYGAEFFINKARGKWTGWLGYTLSWTKRNFENLNDGKTYFAKFDRRHDISLVNTYELNKKWTLSQVFIFSSGNRVTLPTDLVSQDNTIIAQYDILNNQQLPPYHRMDLGAVYTPNPNSIKKYKSSWAFSIYNVYNRFNPYIIFLDPQGSVNGNGGVQLSLTQISIFPIIPSVTWNFKF
jgi:hypothetical protein